MLAQTFARTYKGHESEPCCPIYTEPTVAGTQGNPRSTVQEVYDQLNSDIDKAIELLNGTERKHISHINYATALGLKARIALVMEDWNTAKAAAKEAITASQCTVLPVENFAGLNNSSAANVMWELKSFPPSQPSMQVSSHTWMLTDQDMPKAVHTRKSAKHFTTR